MKANAYGKLNLSLEIVGRYEDGYHEIRSIFQKVSLFDEIECRFSDIVYVDFDIYPDVPETSVHKAVNLFMDRVKPGCGVEVYVRKMILAGTGLGGGSSDAATTLLLLNELFGFPLNAEELISISEAIGFDVPFFIKEVNTGLVEEKGEVIIPLRPLQDCYFLIVFPHFRLLTRDAYEFFDKYGTCHPDSFTGRLKEGIERGESVSHLEPYFYNDFERLFRKYDNRFIYLFSEVEDLTSLNFHLTGSGSAIFAVTESREILEQASRILKSKGYRAELVSCVR